MWSFGFLWSLVACSRLYSRRLSEFIGVGAWSFVISVSSVCSCKKIGRASCRVRVLFFLVWFLLYVHVCAVKLFSFILLIHPAFSSPIFLSQIFLSASSIHHSASCDLGCEFFSVLGCGASDFSGAWWPARDSTREDFLSLSELELGALSSPFPPFAPVK